MQLAEVMIYRNAHTLFVTVKPDAVYHEMTSALPPVPGSEEVSVTFAEVPIQLTSNPCTAEESFHSFCPDAVICKGNLIVFTCNRNPSLWWENFHEEDSLLCALDRIFDAATVFNIHGGSFRGKHLETYALQEGKIRTADNCHRAENNDFCADDFVHWSKSPD